MEFCRYPAYGALYTVLEVLALPAVPLTMTAGLLFGVGPGAAVVSVSATIAATISFLIARYAGDSSLLSSESMVKAPESIPAAACTSSSAHYVVVVERQEALSCDILDLAKVSALHSFS